MTGLDDPLFKSLKLLSPPVGAAPLPAASAACSTQRAIYRHNVTPPPRPEPPPLGGLVISLDGGFEEVDEPRCIRAIRSSNASIFATNGASKASTSAWVYNFSSASVPIDPAYIRYGESANL